MYQLGVCRPVGQLVNAAGHQHDVHCDIQVRACSVHDVIFVI